MSCCYDNNSNYSRKNAKSPQGYDMRYITHIYLPVNLIQQSYSSNITVLFL